MKAIGVLNRDKWKLVYLRPLLNYLHNIGIVFRVFKDEEFIFVASKAI